MTKIVAVLPTATRAEVEGLSDIIEFFAPPARFDLDDPHLVLLQHAIRERRVVRLLYRGYRDDEATEREVEPQYLTYSQGWWYLNGYCRRRGGLRSFRLSRIEVLHPLPETFALRDESAKEPGTQFEVRVRVGVAARRLRERQHYGFVGEEPVGDEPADAIMIDRVDAVAELVPWLLQWGADVEVLSPQEFRDQIREEALRIAALLAEHSHDSLG
jgi:proteasome accessory factor B